MSDDLNDSILQKITEEHELSKWGIDLYSVRADLPTIDIPLSDMEDYLVLCRDFSHIANEFGKDVSYIFSQLCQAYEIENEKDLEDPFKFTIQLTSTYLLNIIAHSLKQCEILLDIIGEARDENKEIINLPGTFYYFIPIVIQNIFASYCVLINYMFRAQYMSEEFITETRFRLNFMISPEFEDMRRKFKVVECYKVAREAEGVKLTLH